jgi:hypothetical protein
LGDRIVAPALGAVRPRGKISHAFNFLKRKNNRVLSIEEVTEISRRGWAGKR